MMEREHLQYQYLVKNAKNGEESVWEDIYLSDGETWSVDGIPVYRVLGGSDSLMGMINARGNKIIAPIYDWLNLQTLPDFVVARKGGREGLLSPTGDEVLFPFDYPRIAVDRSIFHGKTSAGRLATEHDLVVVITSDKAGYYGIARYRSGKTLKPPEFDRIKCFGHNLTAQMTPRSGKRAWAALNFAGEFITDFVSADPICLDYEFNCFRKVKDYERVVIVNQSGETVHEVSTMGGCRRFRLWDPSHGEPKPSQNAFLFRTQLRCTTTVVYGYELLIFAEDGHRTTIAFGSDTDEPLDWEESEKFVANSFSTELQTRIRY